ncbi:laccase [Jaapia argillacea MUCL 33604]|uniref:laccase n=1 Tax=Jaapia argillacea MUCL 33604 TaxID=933084 RepID=A0A067Q6P7_9AGAM|nr:laccase [Jaapia argillacea MUCL 33604]
MLLLSAIASLGLAFGAYAAIGPVTDLDIYNAIISPDGYNRSAVLADGAFPGPLIVGNKGDNFRINVRNRLIDPTMLRTTTIHWHGLFQKGTTWADGPAFVNQCPIASSNAFLYDFDVPGQAGTYWYHSHLSTQYCDGLRGPLVVYDPEDPYSDLYDVDDESTVITLAEWYHVVAPDIVGVAISNSTLINGKGRYSTGPKTNLSVISIEPGKRYRFRLVSLSCDPNFTFSIDGHNLTIIEVDGVNHEPLTVDQITIYAGQRYSFILEANQPVDNYWIRALPNNGLSSSGFSGGLNSAILRYAGANSSDPTTNQTGGANPLVETNLHVSLVSPGLPIRGGEPGSDVFPINLNVAINGTNGLFYVNNHTFVPPTVPVLLQLLSGAQQPPDLLPEGSVYYLPKNRVIELSVPAQQVGVLPGGPHPIHLHGHTFSVVRSANSSVYNYKNPVRRDVVAIGNPGNPGDNVTIRFTTDNTGIWFLHCHIDWHLQAGFAIVLAEDTPDVRYHNPTPPDWDTLCPIYDALPQSALCVGSSCNTTRAG